MNSFLVATLVACVLGVRGGLIDLNGATTAQSSTEFGGDSARAVDGNKDSNYGEKSCTHTGKTAGAWWSVDLGDTYSVESVSIYNRQDCCTSRNNELHVVVVDADGGENKCGVFSGTAGEVTTVECSGVTGNTVKIVMAGTEYLTLCEVEVSGSQGGGPVTFISASQSSTAFDGEAARGIDGNKDANYGTKSCTHTSKTDGAWWAGEMNGEYLVSSVTIYNRQDCCTDRNNNLDVIVVGADGTENACGSFSGTAGEVTTVDCGAGAAGTSIKIKQAGTEYLTLCEVEAAGSQAPSAISFTSASQSSIGWDGQAARAIDGNMDSNYGGKSCTHTSNSAGEWWSGEMSGDFTVSSVKIYNRQDCCTERSNSLDVVIVSSDGTESACGEFRGTAGEVSTVECAGGATGNQVKIIVAGTQYLTICEVEAIGVAA